MTARHGRPLVALVAAVIAVAGCGDGPPDASPTTTIGLPGDGTVPAPEGIPIPDGASMYDVASTRCDSGPEGADDAQIETAFLGTVRTVDDADPAPWVTFDVESWYTADLGTEIALWAPGWAGAPGERWLVAAARYAVGPLASGEVFDCDSEIFSATALAAWDLRFGSPVVAGAGVPERPADPGVLAAIEEAAERWRTTSPTDYTYALGYHERSGRTADHGVCGRGTTRIVVESGLVTQARDVDLHCDVPLDEVPTIAELFEITRRVAGAVAPEAAPSIGEMFDPTFGFPRAFDAEDRSVEVSMWIDEFVPAAVPVAGGDAAAVVAEARARWAAAGIESYTATLDIRCFCAAPETLELRVEDGRRTSPVPAALDWLDPTVDGIFDLIERTRLDDAAPELAFDPDTGAPVSLRFEGELDTVDDELGLVVHDLVALP